MPANASFYGFDFTPADNQLAGELQGFFRIIPHPAKCFRRRDVETVMPKLVHEVERRLASEGATPSAQSIYLVIFGLQRARDLREDDNDAYRRNDSDEPPPPSPIESFKTILRDGPEVGIHTIVWCDTMKNVDRAIGRHGLREFAMRVAMQMGEQDSSDLLDTPVACKLGPNRAYLFMEEEGTLEKFRPYAWTKQWLQFAAQRLQSKGKQSADA